MVGRTASAIAKLCETSQVSSALGSVERNVTVSYGPTTFCSITWTSFRASPALNPLALELPPQPNPPPPLGDGGGGPVITGWVLASSAPIHASRESSTWVPCLTGSTQANSRGSPEYWIWSHKTVCVGETAKAMRWSVTTVVSVGGMKQPPHAWASPSTSAAPANARSAKP